MAVNERLGQLSKAATTRRVIVEIDGKRKIVEAPRDMSNEDIQRDLEAQTAPAQQAKKPTSFWQGVTEGMQPAFRNLDALVDTINPVSRLTDALGLSDTKADRQFKERKAKELQSRSKYRGSTAGKITGGIAATLPTAAIPGGAIPQGAAAGALLTEGNSLSDYLKNAAIGGAAGKAGEVIGRRVVAPVARKVADTASRAVGKAVPALSRSESAVTRFVPDIQDVRANVKQAADLGLPYSLADADPRLRTLAGSVARVSPEARNLAEQTFGPRAAGQADRAISAIDDYLAPITDIDARAADIMESGKSVYDPLYRKAYQGPVVTSPDIESILSTPAGRTAVGKANTIAANEFRDPRALGFAIDDAGNTVLNPPPVPQMNQMDEARQAWDSANAMLQNALRKRQASLNPSSIAPEVQAAEAALAKASSQLDAAKASMQATPRGGTVADVTGYTPQSLDYVKGALDDMLEPYRNQITNKLDLDRNGRAINAAKNKLLEELDRLNPDYRAARAAYGNYAGKAGALRTGKDVLPSGTLPMRSFEKIVERAKAYDAGADQALSRVPELQRGYATAMADAVERARLSSNPYNTVYGSPLQQEKVGALFPGASKFGDVYGLETQMAKTAQETLGGSPTQARAMADQLFTSEGPLPSLVELATSPKTGILRAGVRAVKDRAVAGGAKKASEIAPALYKTDPQWVLDYIDQLLRNQAAMQARSRMFAEGAGAITAPVASVSGVSSTR